MDLTEDDMTSVVKNLWSDSFSIELAPSPDADDDLAQASVDIQGKFRIMVSCSPPLLRHAAATFFNVPASDATDADLRDALGEIANIAAGNMKALLEGEHDLGLPNVHTLRDGRAIAQGRDVLHSLHFRAETGSFALAVE